MSRKADPEALVRYLVDSLVAETESVDIIKRSSGDSIVFEVSVAPDDVGKVIGRQGRVIKAIRTVARAAASINGERVDVEVLG